MLLRLARIEDLIRRDLENEEAPKPTFRWVAWAANGHHARRQRADLVLHLRHTIDTPAGGWHREEELGAAWETWQALVREARRTGVAQPRACDVPTTRYQDAIDSVARSARKTPQRPAPPAVAPGVLTQEQRQILEPLIPMLRELLERAG